MTYKILLACAAGMSTSMLVERMEEAAKKMNLDVIIDAVPEGKVEKVINDFDILLLGPQVAHLAAQFREEIKDKKIPVDTIDMMDYGMMDGEKVLRKVIKLLGEKI